MLSKIPAIAAIIFYKIPIIFKNKGYFDYIFFNIDDISSMKFRNLNIFLEFFIEFLNLKLITTDLIALILNAFLTS